DRGTNGDPFVQLYPSGIDYTSHVTGSPPSTDLAAIYHVRFVLDCKHPAPTSTACDDPGPGDIRRHDVAIQGRAGFQVLTRYRLDHVDVLLRDQIIRRYRLEYQDGDFQKSLLHSIALLGLRAEKQLYEHTFDYFSAPKTQDGSLDAFSD